MKRLLLLPALLLGTASFAETAKYEISPMIGYNFAEGNLGMKNDGYYTGGLEVQFNSPDSKISPEFSLFYTHKADFKGVPTQKTNIIRGAFNGVYTFEGSDTIKPFVKAGLGIENFTNNLAGNNDNIFADAGAGVKFPFTKHFALKLEAIYMAKLNSDHAGRADSNLMTLAGFTYSFGYEPKPEPKEEVVEEVVAVAVVAEVDSDGDGVIDSLDKCPDTPKGSTVNAEGCPVVLDSDHDGVIDSKDLCPNTPAGEKVDVNGCPVTVNLHVNFANDSAVVPADAAPLLDKYAAFLKRNINYSAKIVGYTDNRGSEAYNLKLSDRRAKAVMQALIARGVNPAQLSAIGMGEANPIASNDTAEGRAQNRRIEAELTFNAQ